MKGYVMKRFISSVLLAAVLAISPFAIAAPTDVAPNPTGYEATSVVLDQHKAAPKQRSFKQKQTQARKIKPSKRLKRGGAAYYKNVDGQRIQRPTQTSSGGSSFRCNDGSYSYSTHRRGACSHHGGIAHWYTILKNLPLFRKEIRGSAILKK